MRIGRATRTKRPGQSGRADRRPGVRGFGPRDVRRQRADRPRRYPGPARRARRRPSTLRAPPSSSPMSTARDEAELRALERLMLRIGAWPPVVAVTQSFDENVARRLMQMRVADFLVKPVPPVELVRTCARVAKAARPVPRRRKRRFSPFCPRSAAPASPRSRCRRRCCCSTAAPRGKIGDLPGRSRFPARRLRRLSRYRAAP